MRIEEMDRDEEWFRDTVVVQVAEEGVDGYARISPVFIIAGPEMVVSSLEAEYLSQVAVFHESAVWFPLPWRIEARVGISESRPCENPS